MSQPDPTAATSIETRLAELEATVARLAAENAALRTRHDLAAATTSDHAPMDESISRRRAFTRLGGAALGVATVYGVVNATPAAATSSAILSEVDNPVSDKTSISSLAPFEADVLTVRARTNGDAITGFGGVGAQSAGVWGQAEAGWGVYGTSNTGYAIYAAGRIGIASFGPKGAPTAGTYALRDIVGDDAGNLYCCVEAGAPGKWRLINAAVAPQFHAIAPIRAYDSRAPLPAAAILSAGASRVVPIADGRDIVTGVVTAANAVPVGATAITFNLTIANTTANGFLAVTAGDATAYAASTINWTAAKTTIANGGVIPVSAAREIKVWAGGVGSTDFIVDVTGYYA
ncbi:MAG: hypothetical protein JWN39_251 [Ilumatobacteraceae bacterium]|nr:hypothetical protein [Ilumatobacteraceae bacterium]